MKLLVLPRFAFLAENLIVKAKVDHIRVKCVVLWRGTTCLDAKLKYLGVNICKDAVYASAIHQRKDSFGIFKNQPGPSYPLRAKITEHLKLVIQSAYLHQEQMS